MVKTRSERYYHHFGNTYNCSYEIWKDSKQALLATLDSEKLIIDKEFINRNKTKRDTLRSKRRGIRNKRAQDRTRLMSIIGSAPQWDYDRPWLSYSNEDYAYDLNELNLSEYVGKKHILKEEQRFNEYLGSLQIDYETWRGSGETDLATIDKDGLATDWEYIQMDGTALEKLRSKRRKIFEKRQKLIDHRLSPNVHNWTRPWLSKNLDNKLDEE